ncbi:hypothetical protein ACQSSU_24515 [Micromonospora echinospora]
MQHLSDFASAQDVEDADDILFAHPIRTVTRLVCACGADHPCPEVRFALMIKGTTSGGTR